MEQMNYDVKKEMTELAVSIGEKIKKLRIENGYTMWTLSQKLGVTIFTLRNWEHGRTLMTLNRLYVFAKIFNVQILDLLEG